MGAHLIDGEFQSDKYPTTPRGKVPLSVRDPAAQDLLWIYAQRRRAVDQEFAGDLEAALLKAGFERTPGTIRVAIDDLNRVLNDQAHLMAQRTELQSRMTAMIEEHRVEVAHLRGTIETAFASGYQPKADSALGSKQREVIACELESWAKSQLEAAKLKEDDAPCSAYEHEEQAKSFSHAAKLVRLWGEKGAKS